VTGRDRRSAAGTGGDDDGLEEQVHAVIAATFDLDEDELPAPVTREAISRWTSRSQMTLLLNLEVRFAVSFTLEQMVTMTSARRIADALRETMASPPGP
jgi:acyl carrier protein